MAVGSANGAEKMARFVLKLDSTIQTIGKKNTMARQRQADAHEQPRQAPVRWRRAAAPTRACGHGDGRRRAPRTSVALEPARTSARRPPRSP